MGLGLGSRLYQQGKVYLAHSDKGFGGWSLGFWVQSLGFRRKL